MNLTKVINQFFRENDFDKLANKIATVRYDGVVVYSNTNDFGELSSIGALVGGLWQAAEALNSIVSTQTDIYEFRLSFDVSDQGIYVLPFKIKKVTYYICAIYKDVRNPALLKNQFRFLKENLSVFLNEYASDEIELKNEYLFNNITDEEIERLFSHTRI